MNREYTVWQNSDLPVRMFNRDLNGLTVIAFFVFRLYLLNCVHRKELSLWVRLW
jgi:hypothetical protein